MEKCASVFGIYYVTLDAKLSEDAATLLSSYGGTYPLLVLYKTFTTFIEQVKSEKCF